MAPRFGRRQFVRSSATAAAIVGLGELAALAPLSPAIGAETTVAPGDLRPDGDVEPLVRLIEATPREAAVAMMIEQLRRGVSYRQFLAALFVAAARLNVSPHHVYMIHSAHQLGLDVAREDRLLPLFWALDTLQIGREEGPRFPRVNAGLLPSPQKAAAELEAAMQRFDGERAEAALISLVRNEGARPALGRLWHYVARDSSNIGHRAIAFVNAWRTLETVGWVHAEPLCQFVVRELTAGKYTPPLYPANVERAEKRLPELPPNWAGSEADPGATLELLALLHEGDGRRGCQWVMEALQRGTVQAQSVWDAIFLAAGELMLRFNTYVSLPARPLHTSTSMNALRYAFDAGGDARTRLYTLLMAVDWTASYVATERDRGKLRAMTITAIPAEAVPGPPGPVIEQIFALQPVRRFDPEQKRFSSVYEGNREDMDPIVRLAYAYAQQHPDHALFLQTARRLVCLKATDNAHDVKFPAAIFENYRLASPQWRPHLLAASIHWLLGTRMEDAAGVKQARDALRGG
jgi:hypothetical protein